MQTCTRCLYNDKFIPGLKFDANGVCEYCHKHDAFEKEYPATTGYLKLSRIINSIRKSGKNKLYDCVIGISGGCDSSYLLMLTKVWGLRPLAVHWDNGWNTDIANRNMEKLCNKLKINQLIYRPSYHECKDIWKSFMKANSPDLEAPTDIALTALSYLACEKFGVKYILNGHSFRTEGWVPKGKSYMDGKYIKSVHAEFGSVPMKTFLNLSMMKFLKWIVFNRIKVIRPLYYLDYKKDVAIKYLQDKFGWEWYHDHHCENIFTEWFAKIYRMEKCDFDSRVVEYSALIRSGQMNRELALELLSKPIKINEHIEKRIKDEFPIVTENYLCSYPAADRNIFKTYKNIFKMLKFVFWLAFRLNMIPRTFYEKYCQ